MIDIDMNTSDIHNHNHDNDSLSLTLSHVNHLKLALNKEKDKVYYERNVTEDLKKEVARYDALLSAEKLISQLSILSCTTGGGKDPFLVVNAIKELLFPAVNNSFTIWCCIRTGDNWTVVRSNSDNENSSNSNSSKIDKDFLGKISINTFDGLVRTLQIGSLYSLSNMLSNDEINKIYIEGNSNSKININYLDTCMARINPRCVWLFWGTDLFRDVSNVLSDYFSVIDVASQLTMAGLVHYIEYQEVYAEKIAGQAVTEITKLLYKDLNTENIRLLDQLQQIPIFLRTLISMSSCDIFFFDGLHSISNSTISNLRTSTDEKIVAINTALEITIIDLSLSDVDNSLKNQSVLASAVSKNQSVCCFDNQNPKRNKIIDCGGLSLEAIVACPLWPTNSSGRLLAGGIIFRYENSGPTSIEIRSMIAVANAIGPILQTWLEITELGALSLLRQQPKSLASPFDSTFPNTNSLKLSDMEITSVPSRVMDDMTISYNKVVEEGLSGLINDNHSMQSIARTFDCDWALAILVLQSNNLNENFEEEINLDMVNNVGMRRSFNTQEIDNFLKRTVMYMLQEQKSVENENELEIISGIDAENSGVLQLLNINSSRAAVLGTLPAHLHHMLCFSVNDALTSNDDSEIRKIIFIVGRNWQPFSRVAMQPRVKCLIENVSAALECRYLRSMYKFTHVIQEKVSAMEYMKINEERIKLLEKGLEEIGDKYRSDLSGADARKALISVISRFCFQNITLDDLENMPNAQYSNHHESVASVIVRDSINDKERIWLLDESGEWVLNQSLEKIIKEIDDDKLDNSPKLLTIFADRMVGESVTSYSLTLEIVVQYTTEKSNDIANLSDILLVQEMRQRLEAFVKRYCIIIFGSSEEFQLKVCDDHDLPNSEYSIKAIDNGIKTLGQVFSNGLTMDTTIASESLLSGIREMVPQFLLFPITTIGEKGVKENISIAFATNSSPSYAQLPIRIVKVLANDENKSKDVRSTLSTLDSALGSVFYNFLLDCGMNPSSNQQSTLAVYRYYYRGFGNKYASMDILALSRSDLLVAPTHFQRLRHLLDCTLLPLQLHQVFTSFNTLVSSTSFMVAMEESLDISQYNSLSLMQPTESDQFENINTDKGFIEEALDLVQKEIDETYEFRKAYNICLSTMKSLMTSGKNMIGHQCFASAAFFLPLDEILFLLQNKGIYDITESLQLCHTEGLQLSEGSRWNPPNSRSYPTGECIIDIDILDVIDVESKLVGLGKGMYTLSNTSDKEDIGVKVLCISISFTRNTFKLDSDNSKRSVTVASALFWFHYDTKISADNSTLFRNVQLDKIIGGCSEYFLKQLFVVAGSLMAFEIRNSLHSGKALAAIYSRLVDEVSKGLAFQSLLTYFKSIMSADKPSNLSHGFILALRRKGYVDSESSSLLYDTEKLRDEMFKQESTNDDLHRLLVASQLQCTEFTEFIAAINKMCSNDIIGQFADQDALTPNGMLQAFVVVALNNFTLHNSIKLLCDLGYHEHVTINLRSLIISIFGNGVDKDITSWIHRADIFMNAAKSSVEFIKSGDIHQDDSLVIAWCMDQKVEQHVQGVRSWDMLNRALESTNAVVVEDKDSQTITTYNPINSCAVMQHTFQDHANNPGAAIALEFTNMLVHTMGNQMQESELFKRLQHSDDNLYYQKWSNYLNHLLSEDPSVLNEKLETVANLLHDSIDSSDVDTRLIDLVSYKAAVIAGHGHDGKGCFLLPYNSNTDEDKFYVGHVFNASHDKYKVCIPVDKLGPFLKSEMLNKPNIILSESVLSEGSKYIVYLPLAIEDNGIQKVVILLCESELKPKESSLLEMKVLGDEINMVTSKIRFRKNEVLFSQELSTQISCLDQTILNQKETLQSLERKLLCKVLLSDITLAKDVLELDELLKNSLPSVLTADSVSLIRVTKSVLDNHGSIVHSESVKEFNSVDDEKTAGCLISNSTVLATDGELIDNITGAYGIVYVPILYHLAKGQLSQEDALDDFDYCWVLKVSFSDTVSMTAFKEINFNVDCKGDDICMLIQEIKRWMRAYRHKLISYYRSQTLSMLGSLCEQFTNGMYLVSQYQNDGYISEVEGFAAAVTQIFNISNLNSIKQHIQSARLHWFVDGSLVGTSMKSNFKSESAWYTCDLPTSVSNTVNSPTMRDAVLFGSLTTTDNDVVYNYDILQQMLRMEKWNKRQSLNPNDLLATVQESKGFIYKTASALSSDQDGDLVPCLFISVGSTQQPTVFQFIFSKGSRLMANAEDTKSVIHLLRETISQSLQFMQKLKIANSSLLAGECEARLTRRLLRIKSRCYNEICAEATSGYNIVNLCSGVQALLVKQPGVHSVWLSCIDTINGSIMYQQLCGVQSVLSLSSDEIAPLPTQSDSNKLLNLGMSASAQLSPTKKSNENADIYWSTELPSGRKNTEFVLECREMAGRLVVYYLSDDELRIAAELTAKRTNYIEAKNADMKDYTLGMGYDAEILLWLTSKNEVYQQLEREVFRGLCRTLARRIFELNKGQQNKQLLIDRKNDLLSHKSKLESADTDMKKLEATRDSLALQLEQSLADAANLKSRLREEQEQTAILERKHRDVQRATTATVYDLKNECARKDSLLQRALTSVQEERRLGEERREAVILDLQRDSERVAESNRRATQLELKTLEKHFQQQASKNDLLVKSLQQDVTNASERERASIEAYEKRLSLLVTKLREAEQELLQNRNSIKNLRKELTIITAFDENN